MFKVDVKMRGTGDYVTKMVGTHQECREYAKDKAMKGYVVAVLRCGRMIIEIRLKSKVREFSYEERHEAFAYRLRYDGFLEISPA